MNPASTSTVQPKAYIAVLLVLGSTHLLNDLIQSLIPAIYPIIAGLDGTSGLGAEFYLKSWRIPHSCCLRKHQDPVQSPSYLAEGTPASCKSVVAVLRRL
jgi:hypothetical protein